MSVMTVGDAWPATGPITVAEQAGTRSHPFSVTVNQADLTRGLRG